MIPDYGCPRERQAYAQAMEQCRVEKAALDAIHETNMQAHFKRVEELEARAARAATKGGAA